MMIFFFYLIAYNYTFNNDKFNFFASFSSPQFKRNTHKHTYLTNIYCH